MKKLYLVLCLIYGTAFGLHAQGETNPFELVFRMDSIVAKDVVNEPVLFTTDNPFDIVRVTVLAPEVRQQAIEEKQREAALYEQESDSRIKFLLIIFAMAYLVFVSIFFRSFIQKTFRAFVRDNLLRQFRRAMRNRVELPYSLLFINYLLNLSIFVFFSFEEARIPGYNLYAQFGLLFSAILFIHLGKIILLHFTSALLPIQKEVNLYVFTIIVFASVFGLFLLPMNLLLLYGPENYMGALQSVFLFILLILLTYRAIRGVFLASKFLAFNKLHFLLYICSTEIAPIVILTKVLSP
jgi:hypothetical protein